MIHSASPQSRVAVIFALFWKVRTGRPTDNLSENWHYFWPSLVDQYCSLRTPDREIERGLSIETTPLCYFTYPEGKVWPGGNVTLFPGHRTVFFKTLLKNVYGCNSLPTPKPLADRPFARCIEIWSLWDNFFYGLNSSVFWSTPKHKPKHNLEKKAHYFWWWCPSVLNYKTHRSKS